MTFGLAWMTALGSVALLGFIAGLAGRTFPLALRLFVGGVVASYLILLATAGGWVAACPSCPSHQSYDAERDLDLFMASFWGGLFTIIILGLTRVGMAVGELIHDLRGSHP